MKFILFLSALLCSVCCYSQNYINGKVFDSKSSQPLAGATISSGGKALATTDNAGQFRITCTAGMKLTATYVGYAKKQVTIYDCNVPVSFGLAILTNDLSGVDVISESRDSVLHQSQSITTLRSRELKRQTGLFLDDAINANVAGVTMMKRSISGGQQFNIRGYGNGSRGTAGISSNFDNQGSKVYLNGIPVTDAEGITVLDDIDYATMGKVQIRKGPAGSLYGLAIAGVVNLETIKPQAGTSIGQEVTFGSFGLQRYTTTLQMGRENASVLLTYGHQAYDGFMIHTASHKDFVNFMGEFQPNAKQKITTYVGYNNSYDQRAGETYTDQYNSRTFPGNPAYLKNDAHSEVISFRAGIGHHYKFNEKFSLNNTVFGTGTTNQASSGGGWTDKFPVNYGLRSTMNTTINLPGLQLSGITGIEAQKQRAAIIGYNMVADSNNLAGYNRIGTVRSNQFTINQTASYFTEWTVGLAGGFSITGGVGLSTMKIRLEDRIYTAATNRAPPVFVKSYTGMVSPHLAVNKIFSDAFAIHASYSRGYKAPVSSYFFIPAVGPAFARVNEGLQPELADQFEIGSKGVVINNRLEYQLALFSTMYKKKMTAAIVPLNSTTTLYSYVVNGGKQDHKGLELELKYAAYRSASGFFTGINPWMNLTYSDFKYKDFKFMRFKLPPNNTKDSTLDYSGNPVGGVAPLVYNIGIDVVTRPGLYLNAYYSYRDESPITSDNLLRSKSYTLLNGKIGYRRSLGNHFDLDFHAGGTNLTGNQYYYMVFVNQLNDAYLPAPLKASFFGGVNLRYSFK
jgi:iron complex outermembrane recepter protein